MTEEPKGLYSVKSCPWLLLFVFYLQFITGEMMSLLWTRLFNTAAPELVVLTCVQLFAVAVPCAMFLLLKNAPPKEVIKHKKLSGIGIIMCIIVGFSAQPVVMLINSPIVSHLAANNTIKPNLIPIPQTLGEFFTTLMVVALLPAIFEELLMRGIVLHATEKYGYRASIFISALWFSILHNDLSNILGMFLLGMVLCYAVWMTQSVYAGIVIHFSFNAFALILQCLSPNPSTVVSVLFIIIAIIVFSLSVSSLNRKLVRRYKTHGLFKQLFFAIFNFPMIVIILGFVMFHFI